MTYRLDALHAREILDSRSRPTLAVTAVMAGGATGEAGVPSGASTGTREAVELRDGDPARYGGAGVTAAVANVNGEIADALSSGSFGSLAELDAALIELDGTPTKARLGANAIVGVSMAAARAMAATDSQPLYEWLAPAGVEARLPVPCFNVINGGRHAANRLQPQELKSVLVGRLRENILTQDAQIRVDVDHRLVVLGGEVDSPIAKRVAGDDAWDTPGIVDVSNQLVVSGAS